MKNPIGFAAIATVLVGTIAAYFYWQHVQLKSEPLQAQAPIQAPQLAPPKPEVRQMIEAPVAPTSLPDLADSDTFMLDALAGLVGNRSLMNFFNTERIVHNIVATIDNLPNSRAPMSVMPVKRAPGIFVTAGKESDLTIGAQNAARYTPYVRLADIIDAKHLVEVYVRLYPLFQRAYEELGYPNKYFNDRLMETLDNLLEAPVIEEPIKLVQPNVLYRFADQDLEERSIGQRILMRIGHKNEEELRSKLREIKSELKLHMHKKKVEGTG